MKRQTGNGTERGMTCNKGRRLEWNNHLAIKTLLVFNSLKNLVIYLQMQKLRKESCGFTSDVMCEALCNFVLKSAFKIKIKFIYSY